MTQDATFLQRNRHLLENDRQESNLSLFCRTVFYWFRHGKGLLYLPELIVTAEKSFAPETDIQKPEKYYFHHWQERHNRYYTARSLVAVDSVNAPVIVAA